MDVAGLVTSASKISLCHVLAEFALRGATGEDVSRVVFLNNMYFNNARINIEKIK